MWTSPSSRQPGSARVGRGSARVRLVKADMVMRRARRSVPGPCRRWRAAEIRVAARRTRRWRRPRCRRVWTALATMVESTVSRSSVEFTAWRHFAERAQLLDRAARARRCAGAVRQKPRILDRDDRLTAKAGHKRDLLVGEGTNFPPENVNAPISSPSFSIGTTSSVRAPPSSTAATSRRWSARSSTPAWRLDRRA